MIKTLMILAAIFLLIMVVLRGIEKWLVKIVNTKPKENPNRIYKATLKFRMPRGWYCEFLEDNTLCYGVIVLSGEEHCNGEKLDVKVVGFADTYLLKQP